MKTKYIAVLFISLFLVSCGDDDDNNENGGTPLEPINLATMGDLPPCNEENQVMYVFVEEVRSFLICENDQWTFDQ